MAHHLGHKPLLTGDCIASMRTLPDTSVNCCVTSPPYFNLRDYGHDGQIGLEPTPDAYVAKMVEVFREVRRVLRDDGTCWLNLGDSYAGPKGNNRGDGAGGGRQRGEAMFGSAMGRAHGLPKQLLGIPWRVAFALQADGWVLRQEIIWAKPNPMPESVTDRCTKSHEQLFLFSKATWKGPGNGRFSQITDQDARWLALCIDTEGCIVVKRCKHEGRADTFAPQVSFGSTSAALMDRFVSIVGHGNLASREGTRKPMIYWQAANNVARDFLHRIYPFLIVKQRQARIGIHVDNLTYFRGGKRAERKHRTEQETARLVSLWARNKQLNNFGDPDLSDVPEPIYGRWGEGPRYYFDAKAIAEPYADGVGVDRVACAKAAIGRGSAEGQRMRSQFYLRGGRNRRSVWTVSTKPYKGAHFATFPPDLIEPCILAGCPIGGTVLDPFGGSGTTGQVAMHHHRKAILCELNPDYVTLIRQRLAEPMLPLTFDTTEAA
jgi:DNA modification methylase